MSEVFPDRSIPGGIVHNPGSSHSREMAKWEMGWSPYGPPGRPRELIGHQEYPAAMYRMKRKAQNGDFVVDAMLEAADEVERANLESQGYRMGRKAAQDYVVELEQMVAVAAAERNYSDRNMSEKAKAEIEKVELSTSKHVAEIPETPIKHRGWPKGKPRPKKARPVVVQDLA